MPFIEESDLLELHKDIDKAQIINERLLDQIKHKNKELKRSIEEMERTRQNAACLPASLVKAQSLAGSKCEHGWRTQREENDWNSFLVNFKEVVNLAREEAKARHSASPRELAMPSLQVSVPGQAVMSTIDSAPGACRLIWLSA